MNKNIKRLIIPVIAITILLNVKILHQTIPQRSPVYFSISTSIQSDIEEQQITTPHFISTMLTNNKIANNQ